MTIKIAQTDLPVGLRGGSDAWDQPQASVVLDADFFSEPASGGGQSLSPTRFDNANAFYAPTVGRGAVTLSPARLDNTQAFYAPTVGRGAVTLQPGLLVNANEIYAPEVSAAGLPPPTTPDRRHAGGRRGYIFKGKRYWLNQVELAQLIREEQARIQDVQRLKRNKPKTISAETAKAIEAIIASLNLPVEVEKPQIVEVREVVEYDDDDEAIELLMTL